MAEVMVHYQDYEELKRMIRESGREYDLELIEKAYRLADFAHGDQRRVSGVPYILHPTSVACILVDLGMDTESVVAALLHDVVEDTEISLEEIVKDYNKEIAHLIDGVTKLKKIPFSNREQQQAENIRKMLMAMSDDIRVIIIKLADRLHNMRTIECMREQKRRDKALENMEVYAPIAHRLGIRTVKEEMEDLSIRYLDPIGYKEIEDALAFTEPGRQRFIEKLKIEITEKARHLVGDIYIEGRVKSINGIYRKTFMKGKSIEQIYDIFAVRVIVNSLSDCYNILGVVHDIYTPLPNRFKDYISTPKPNMYQSLHTTVIGKEGVPFEVQIRTWEMHHTAEYGIAAHWKYKLGINKKDSMSNKIEWIRKMLENQSDDDTDILRNIKTDLAQEEVFVFTPKGDVLSLPNGATVIDVAYAIHSAVGNRMIGAKVNHRICQIDYEVRTGDIVEILTTKETTVGPKRDWLSKVKTSEARNKIRSWFKKECREENIERGRAEIDKEFKHNGIILSEEERVEFFQEILKKQFTNLDDFYASLGYGGLLLWKFVPRMKDLYSKKYKLQELEEQPAVTVIENNSAKPKSSNGVIIEGVDDMLVNLARCCNPMRGDKIIGYITRGNGVSIHKCTCKNVPSYEDRVKSENFARWVNARWDKATSVNEIFNTELELTAHDRTGLLADITSVLMSLRINIIALSTNSDSKNGLVKVRFTIPVNSMEHLKGIVVKLSNMKDVESVTRV